MKCTCGSPLKEGNSALLRSLGCTVLICSNCNNVIVVPNKSMQPIKDPKYGKKTNAQEQLGKLQSTTV